IKWACSWAMMADKCSSEHDIRTDRATMRTGRIIPATATMGNVASTTYDGIVAPGTEICRAEAIQFLSTRLPRQCTRIVRPAEDTARRSAAAARSPSRKPVVSLLVRGSNRRKESIESHATNNAETNGSKRNFSSVPARDAAASPPGKKRHRMGTNRDITMLV